MSSPPSSMRRVSAAAVLHVVASVALTWSSHHLFRFYAIPPGVALSATHLLITTLCAVVGLVLGGYRLRRLRLGLVLFFSAAYVALLVMRHVALVYNVVDVYHGVCEVLVPVLALACEVVLPLNEVQQQPPQQQQPHHVLRTYNKSNVFVTMCVLLAAAGMSLATVHTLKCTHVSLGLALATAWLTVYVRRQAAALPHRLRCGAMQLLLYHAPLSALLLSPFVFYSEDVRLGLFLPCPETWWPLMWSGCIAFVWHGTGLAVLAASRSVLLYSMLSYVHLSVVYSMHAWGTHRGLSGRLACGLTLCLVSTLAYLVVAAVRYRRHTTHKQL